jgi:hypothetical protein
MCLNTIISGENRDQIAKNCQFNYAPIEDYMPVELHTGKYYIHKTENISYFEDCLGNQRKLRLNHPYDGFSVIIPAGCLLRFKNKTEAGGLRHTQRIDLTLGDSITPSFANYRVDHLSVLIKPETLSNNALNKSALIETLEIEGDEVFNALLSRMRRDNSRIEERIMESKNSTEKVVDY